MDAARARLADYLGVIAAEVHFGPSTSQNTYVLAQAFRALLQPGDEIIVTNQDHEANSGAWRRLAASRRQGARMARRPAQRPARRRRARAADQPRTRLLTFPHASNVVAHINPVADISRPRAPRRRAHRRGRRRLGAPRSARCRRARRGRVPVLALQDLRAAPGADGGAQPRCCSGSATKGTTSTPTMPPSASCPPDRTMRRSPLRAASPSTSTALDAHHAGAPAQSGVATRAARVRELLRGAELPLLARCSSISARGATSACWGPPGSRARRHRRLRDADRARRSGTGAGAARLHGRSRQLLRRATARGHAGRPGCVARCGSRCCITTRRPKSPD